MELFALFIFTFFFTFIGRLTLYMLSHLRKKKKRKDGTKDGIAIEMKYLIAKFNLDKEKIDNRLFATFISLIDAIIIATTFTLTIIFTDDIVLEYILGLTSVVVFIYIFYEILGRILVKKGFVKNGL